MAMQDYVKAQKIGERQHYLAGTDGSYPYLPTLEDILRGSEIGGKIPLGQFEIPISMIAGTAQSERTNAFSSGFMPLLDYETEFGSKWSALYDSVQEVGVNEPIIVYEYLQNFYVVEGNKRVSVSKYNGAVSILASVTRILPKDLDSPNYRIYKEFIEFYRITGIYEIQMNQPGEFLRLLRVFDPQENDDQSAEPWNDDLRRDVKFLYSIFEEHYLSRNGKRLPISTGDAFLRFAEIYGADRLIGLTSLELRKRIDRIWTEFRVLAEEKPVERILDPTAASKKVSFTKMISFTAAPVLHIAFIYPKNPDKSAWVYNHELGKRHLDDTFGSAITTESYICEPEEAEEKIEEAITGGHTMIFTTSPAFHAASMRMAVAHPEIILLNCSMNNSYKQLRTYYLRIYEAKFITGLIAGSMTGNKRVGYIADYPVYGTPASIGAFALGVKLVNPLAMVYLDWNTLKDHDPAEFFRKKEINLISDRDISAPRNLDSDFGLYGNFGGEPFRLAAPLWNWNSLYESLVRSVLIGAWNKDSAANATHALNYYWGMSSDAINVACSSKLPIGTQKLVGLVQQQMIRNEFDPFSGPVYDQDGRLRIERGKMLTADQIVSIDWLPDNVIGRLPAVSELQPQYQEFTKWNSILPQDSSS
ncbi:MAG: BMP family ABC transporter substrate-binding protein [Oscillospiraceae bacterium]|nr:BMP family ABC transporter substrate-binding protein [Oscillospiraceae bacterium]